jgi:hypothetical protein
MESCSGSDQLKEVAESLVLQDFFGHLPGVVIEESDLIGRDEILKRDSGRGFEGRCGLLARCGGCEKGGSQEKLGAGKQKFRAQRTPVGFLGWMHVKPLRCS